MSDCNNGLFNCITPLPMDASGKMSDYEFLCWIKNSINKIYENLPDKEVLDKIMMLNMSYINAVVEGVDNTGQTSVSSTLNNLIINNPGRIIYIPSGLYNVTETITIPTNEVILLCDPGAEFFTNIPLNCLLQIGSGVTAENLTPFGVIGGKFNGNNVTSYCIYVANWNYSARIFNTYIYNVESVGIQVADTNQVSSQTFISNVNIIGKTNQYGNNAYGILIFGTDNYITQVNIGRCRNGIVFASGGTLVENIHIWMGANDYPQNPTNSDLMQYQSIRSSASNRMSNVHIDNPFIGVYLTSSNTYLSITNLVINIDITSSMYGDGYTPTILYIVFPTGGLGQGYSFNNVCFNVRPNMTGFKTIRYSSFNPSIYIQQTVDRERLFDSRMPYQALNNLRDDDFIFNVINKGTWFMVSSSNQNINPNYYYKCGYISAAKGSATLTIMDRNGGICNVSFSNTQSGITVTRNELIQPLTPNKSLVFSDEIITLDSIEYYAIYIKYATTAPDYNGVLISCTASTLPFLLTRDNNTTSTMEYVESQPSGVVINLYN